MTGLKVCLGLVRSANQTVLAHRPVAQHGKGTASLVSCMIPELQRAGFVAWGPGKLAEPHGWNKDSVL